MKDITPNQNMKDLVQNIKYLEVSKIHNEKDVVSIASGSVSPVREEDTAVNVKDSYLGSTQEHVFTLPVNLSYWSNIYEKANYEGRRRFDPLFQWASSEEKKLVRKVISLSTTLDGDIVDNLGSISVIWFFLHNLFTDKESCSLTFELCCGFGSCSHL